MESPLNFRAPAAHDPRTAEALTTATTARDVLLTSPLAGTIAVEESHR
jgi:hypothetical protein